MTIIIITIIIVYLEAQQLTGCGYPLVPIKCLSQLMLMPILIRWAALRFSIGSLRAASIGPDRSDRFRSNSSRVVVHNER